MVTEFISSLQCRERYAMARRKRKELTLQEKVEVIDFKNKNPATALRQIANKFQCGKTQIQSILRDQQNLLDKFTASGNADSKRARTGWVENEDLRPKTQKRRPPQSHL